MSLRKCEGPPRQAVQRDPENQRHVEDTAKRGPVGLESLPPSSRRHGRFPDVSLRRFAGWPEGLLGVYKDLGTGADGGRR